MVGFGFRLRTFFLVVAEMIKLSTVDLQIIQSTYGLVAVNKVKLCAMSDG